MEKITGVFLFYLLHFIVQRRIIKLTTLDQVDNILLPVVGLRDQQQSGLLVITPTKAKKY